MTVFTGLLQLKRAPGFLALVSFFAKPGNTLTIADCTRK